MYSFFQVLQEALRVWFKYKTSYNYNATVSCSYPETRKNSITPGVFPPSNVSFLTGTEYKTKDNFIKKKGMQC